MPRGIRAFLILAAGLAALAALYSCGSSRHVSQPSGAAGPTRQFSPTWQKGVSFPGWSYDIYDTVAHPQTADSLRQLRALNATWVAIIPTWYMSTRSTNTIAPEATGGTVRDADVESIIDLAHSLGLKVMLKPHIDTRDGTWRGSISPSKPSAWFESYQTFILHYADLAARKGVEQFSVGCELKSMSGPTYTANWRAIVAAVRGRYQGALTYAANWGHTPDAEYLRVAWWDDLDYIGVDAFFPLCTVVHDAANTDPTYYADYVEQIKAGWFTYVRPGYGQNHWMDELKGLCDKFGRRVLFTEIGYDSKPNAADIWYTSAPGTPDQEAQRACVDAALQVWDQRSWIAGVFWWSWNTNPARGGASDTGMDLNSKSAVATITDWFGRTFTDDVTKPSTPTGLATQGLSTTEIRLTWDEATDNVGVAIYNVFRGGTLVGSPTATTFTDSGLTAGTAYPYQVSAVDAAANESPRCSAVSGTPAPIPDTEAPSTPAGLTVTSATSDRISLSWSPSTDNVAVAGYNVYRNGAKVGSSTTTAFTDSGLQPSTTYQYRLDAFDASGNASPPSAEVSATTASPDTQAPSVPTGLAVVTTTATQISLRWNASTDNVGVTGYLLVRNGSQVAAPTSTTYTDSGLAAGTTYAYQVRAVDEAGNASDPCPVVQGATQPAPSQGYDFEDGTVQGWSREGTCASVRSVSGIRYQGAYSLGLAMSNASAKQPGGAGVTPGTSLTPGRTVTLRTYQAGSGDRVQARAYILDARGRASYGARISLQQGAWLTLSVTVPTTARTPLGRLGVQITTKNGTYTGDVHVDDVRW